MRMRAKKNSSKLSSRWKTSHFWHTRHHIWSENRGDCDFSILVSASPDSFFRSSVRSVHNFMWRVKTAP